MHTTLDDTTVNQHLSVLDPKQAQLMALLRKLILDNDKGVSERIEDGKWLHGYFKYDSPSGHFVYALGARSNGKVSLHLMTYYGSPDVQQKYGSSLKPYISGKSCFDFSAGADLPIEILENILRDGSKHLDEYVSQLKTSKG